MSIRRSQVHCYTGVKPVTPWRGTTPITRSWPGGPWLPTEQLLLPSLVQQSCENLAPSQMCLGNFRLTKGNVCFLEAVRLLLMCWAALCPEQEPAGTWHKALVGPAAPPDQTAESGLPHLQTRTQSGGAIIWGSP